MFFNIYLSDLYLFVSPNIANYADDNSPYATSTDIANYADDNSPYATSTDTESVRNHLENEAKSLLQWLQNNAFKANPDKSNLLLNSTDNSLPAFIDGHEIKNSNVVKLLGISIDNALKWTEQFTV